MISPAGLVDDSGYRSGVRIVDTGGGYNAQSELDAFLVRPENCADCRVEVRFKGPGGGTTATFDLPADLGRLPERTLVVRRP